MPNTALDYATPSQKVVVTLGTRLAAARTLAEAGRIIADTAQELFGWDAFSLLFVHTGEELMVEPVLVMDTIAGQRQEVPPQQIAGPPSAMTRRTLTEGPQLILRRSPEEGAGETFTFGDHQRRSASLMNVPVRREGRAVCILSVQSYTPNAYTPEQLRRLEQLGGHAAGALDRIQAERALHQSEQRFQAIVEATPNVAIQGYDRHGRVRLWNAASERMFGWSAAEAMGRTLDQLIHTPEETAAFHQLLGELAGTGRSVGPAEYSFHHRDGSRGWCLSTLFEIPGPQGEPLFICMDTDITQRRRAEESLRAEADFHRAIVQHAAEGLCVCHAVPEFPYVRFTEWNSQMTQLTGYTMAEINERGWYQSLYPDPDVRARAIARMDRMREGENLRGEIWEITRADGTHRLVAISTSVLQSGDGPAHVLGLMQDVTEREQAERAYRASEARFRSVAENMGDGLVITTLDDVVIDVNRRILELTGRTRAELIGRPAYEVFNVPGEAAAMRERNAQRARGQEGRYQLRLIRGDGSSFWAEVTGAPLRGERGDIIGTIGVVRDITERLAREQALREREARLRAIVETEPDCVKTVSPEGKLIEMNPAGLAMLEVSSLADACARPLIEWLHPEHRSGFMQLHRQVMAGGTGTLRFRIRGATGTERWQETHAVPLRDDDGRVTAALAITRDISEQVRAEERRAALEEQLRHAQKVEAIGTLAGGIAHDFNNILGAIYAFTETARMDAEGQREILSSLDEVLKAAGRAKDLVRQILTFSRRQSSARRVGPLAPVFTEAVRFLRSTLPANVEIQVSVDLATPHVFADASQMHQILINLCTNAAHAIGATGHGQISLSLAPRLVAGGDPELQPGPHVCLTVSDTGSGIAPDVMERIFDPFFTTKAPGEGTGLGLAVVHGIVKEHQGAIRVRSQLGQGTTFEILLPAATATQETITAPSPTTPLPRGAGQSVLLVDDEPSICKATSTLLERLGYIPTAFTDPIAALRAFEANPQAWALVITDLTMPNMNGMALAERILQLRPELPMLLCTGFSGTWTPETIHAAGLHELLPKPVSLEVLAQSVHHALTRQKQSPQK